MGPKTKEAFTALLIIITSLIISSWATFFIGIISLFIGVDIWYSEYEKKHIGMKIYYESLLAKKRGL
jgi:hypothetical protein